MGQQEDVFLNGEGNAWYHRNKNKTRSDEVLPILQRLKINPSNAIEFGCSDGWRMAGIKRAFPDTTCWGIDPSKDAIRSGSLKYPDINLREGILSGMWHGDYDLIILGFCMYVSDPAELSRSVYFVDQALNDNGHLIIHDFDPDYPHRVAYHHEPGVWSWKMDYSRLWLANPAYILVEKNKLDEDTAIWTLQKRVSAGWPEKTL